MSATIKEPAVAGAPKLMLPTGLLSSVRVPAVSAAVEAIRMLPVEPARILGFCFVRRALDREFAAGVMSDPPVSAAVKFLATSMANCPAPAVKPVAPTAALTVTWRMRSLRLPAEPAAGVGLRKEKTGELAARPAAMTPLDWPRRNPYPSYEPMSPTAIRIHPPYIRRPLQTLAAGYPYRSACGE